MIVLLFRYSVKSPQRLLHFLFAKLDLFNFTFRQIQHLLQNRQVTINEKIITHFDDQPFFQDALIRLQIANFPAPKLPWQITIHYIDNALMVVQKPPGIVTHCDAHHPTHSVAQQIYPYVNFPATTNYPGIVHRLDKGTSGLLLVARTPHIATQLKHAISQRRVQRYYLALVQGTQVPLQFVVNAPLVKQPNQQRVRVAAIGKPAETHFVLLQQFRQFALLQCRLTTGRTHQIRAHLQHIKLPIVNDALYNSSSSTNVYPFLQAFKLCFVHPLTPHRFYEFVLQMPNYFSSFIKQNK